MKLIRNLFVGLLAAFLLGVLTGCWPVGQQDSPEACPETYKEAWNAGRELGYQQGYQAGLDAGYQAGRLVGQGEGWAMECTAWAKLVCQIRRCYPEFEDKGVEYCAESQLAGRSTQALLDWIREAVVHGGP
jgi:hypothetical protein